MTDPREPLGRAVHQERVALDAEIAAREGRTRFNLGDWEDRTADQRELDMRIGSAVAAQAVRDAGLENERMRMQLFAIGTALPAARRALVIAIAGSQYEADAKPFRRALEIFGGEDGPADPETLAALGGQEQERSDEDEAAPPVAAELDGQLPLPGVTP